MVKIDFEKVNFEDFNFLSHCLSMDLDGKKTRHF